MKCGQRPLGADGAAIRQAAPSARPIRVTRRAVLQRHNGHTGDRRLGTQRLLSEPRTALDRLEKALFNGHSLDRLGPYAKLKPLEETA